MKNRPVLFFCFAVLIAASPRAFAAEPKSKSIEATVRALDEREQIAILERDIETLEKLMADDFTVNAANRVIGGKQAVLDAFVRKNPVRLSSFERNIEYIRIEGNLAVIMGGEIIVNRDDAPDGRWKAGTALKRRFTNVWKRVGDTWRLSWRHSNVEQAIERPGPAPRPN